MVHTPTGLAIGASAEGEGTVRSRRLRTGLFDETAFTESLDLVLEGGGLNQSVKVIGRPDSRKAGVLFKADARSPGLRTHGNVDVGNVLSDHADESKRDWVAAQSDPASSESSTPPFCDGEPYLN